MNYSIIFMKKYYRYKNWLKDLQLRKIDIILITLLTFHESKD